MRLPNRDRNSNRNRSRKARHADPSARDHAQLASLAETNREHRALGSGAPPALVSGPVDERFEPDTTAYEQAPTPLAHRAC